MRVAVVDDDPHSRDVAAGWISEFGDEPVVFAEAEGTLDDWVAAIVSARCDAAFVDYRLSMLGYASFSGAQLASNLTCRNIGAVLLTTYRRDGIVDFPQYGRRIGFVLQKSQLDDESYGTALGTAIDLAAGKVLPDQEPFRTLVRVDSVEGDNDFVIVPALSFGEGLRVSRSFLSASLGGDVAEGTRFLADVNIGARTADSVFVDAPRKLDKLSEEYGNLLRN